MTGKFKFVTPSIYFFHFFIELWFSFFFLFVCFTPKYGTGMVSKCDKKNTQSLCGCHWWGAAEISLLLEGSDRHVVSEVKPQGLSRGHILTQSLSAPLR